MCGIVGISAHKNKTGSPREASFGLFRSLMVENTSRGKDATGIVYADKHKWEILKGFLPGDKVQNLLMPEAETNTILGHVRYATVGDKYNIDNVHPFETEKFVGVHNGTIFNHKLLKKHFNLKTTGECDSEVVFRLLDKFGIKGLRHVEGLFALAFIRKTAPDTLNIITNGSKPMVFIKVFGNFVGFGSIAKETIEAVEKVFTKGYAIETIKPCTLYQVSNGKIQKRKDCSSFIKYMSEAEGELRYKVDYKILKKDFYNMAVPMRLRLGTPPVKKAVVSYRNNRLVTQSQTNMFPTYPETVGPKTLMEATVSTRLWYTETSKMLLKQYKKRFFDCPNLIQHSCFNMDSLGTLIQFGDSKQLTNYIYKAVFKAEPGQLLFDKQPQFPTASLFPSDKDHTRVFLPHTGQMYVFLTSLMLSDRVYLYSPYRTFKGDEPKVNELLAACFCGLTNRRALINVAEYIKKELIDTKILHNRIICDKEEIKTFVDGPVSHKYAIQNSFANPYSFGKMHEERPYTWYSMARLKEKLFKTQGLLNENVSIMGRGMLLPLLIQNLVELAATGEVEKHIVARRGDIKRDYDIYPIMNALKNKEQKELFKFFDKMLDLTSVKFSGNVRHDLEALEYSFKIAYKTTFGNVSSYNHGFATDIFCHMNRLGDVRTLEEGVKLNIKRILILRRFLLGNKPRDRVTLDDKFTTIDDPK